MPDNRQQLSLLFSAMIGLLINMAGYELFYWPNQFIYFCILVGFIEAYLQSHTNLRLCNEIRDQKLISTV